MNYYNEIDKFAVAWLRELIKEGLISNGVVDDRSICDVHPSDLNGFNQCHFFAGIGGWSYALRLAGISDDAPIWTGSCPCQPFSLAGKQKGFNDERHLWPEFYRLIKAKKPSVVFGEQVASKLGRKWLSDLRIDLEGVGYGVGAADLCAAGIGTPHIRQRLYWGASNSNSTGLALWNVRSFAKKEKIVFDTWSSFARVFSTGSWGEWQDKSEVCPIMDGVPNRVGTVRGAGNAIVPQVAEIFIRSFFECLGL